MTFVEHALSLARRALGSASPNPAVGAVVVKDGVVVGEGWTQPPGRDHAEVMALKQAGEAAVGAVLYTTLEPCNHHGRTPPCAEAIIDARVAEVHAALKDPNSLVVGDGLTRLREAGISTFVGEGEEQARVVMEAYLKFVAVGLPFVTAKFAMSLDGKTATRTGDSMWISGEQARRYVHDLRATSDAIMVGINTVLVDDPRLTARDDGEAPLERQPVRVVVDSRGRLAGGARLLSEPGRTLVAVADVDETTYSRLRASGAEVERVPAEDGSVDLEELLRRLGRDMDIISLLVEGGSTLFGSLFEMRLVDKVIGFVAPVIIGGKEAPSPVGRVGVDSLADVLRLKGVEVSRFGDDVAIIGYC